MNCRSTPLTAFVLAITTIAGLSSARSADRNELQVFQRGNAQASVDTTGANKTNVTQLGGGVVDLKVDGHGNETYVVSGHCWRGALNIMFASCR
jgi:hypothetical protein